jgi:Cu/Zn superoxide dismutase
MLILNVVVCVDTLIIQPPTRNILVTNLHTHTNILLIHTLQVHAEDGSRVACGRLQEVAESELLYALPSALSSDSDSESSSSSSTSSSSVAATVTAHAVDDQLCFFVTAQGLERNLDSYLHSMGRSGVGGHLDCHSQNGCGLHVHSGNSCRDADSQGGPYYNADTLFHDDEDDEDPWLDIGYLYTDSDGHAYHAECVATGEMDYTDHAFIVHANDGSRVACDVLFKHGDE